MNTHALCSYPPVCLPYLHASCLPTEGRLHNDGVSCQESELPLTFKTAAAHTPALPDTSHHFQNVLHDSTVLS